METSLSTDPSRLVYAFIGLQTSAKLAELLGSMGIIAIISANPIMGVFVIASAAWAYVFKRKEVHNRSLAKGGVMATVSVALFTFLGLPLLFELVIVMTSPTLAFNTLGVATKETVFCDLDLFSNALAWL